MRISELVNNISRKGKENKKFLEQKIDIKVTLNDGKEEIWKYTINELVNEFAYLKSNMTMVNIFTKAMASAFYKQCPDNLFFKSCDRKFIDSLKSENDKTMLEGAIKRLENNILNFPNNSSCVIEKGKDETF
jgi:hypothetical protein